jgi:RNA polymerase sigma-70 factor (ECF subfamily)
MELPPPTDPHDERRRRFSSLMREHHRELLIFAGAVTRDRASAQDIVQDAFVSAWRKFGDYDEAGDFGAWMRGIVRNKIKDWFRVRQRQPVGISPEALEFVELEIDIAAWQASRKEGAGVFEIVGECVERLPANFKTAVRRFYFEGLDSEQSAAALGISSANLRKRLERARALLHECIGGKTNAFSQHSTEESHV